MIYTIAIGDTLLNSVASLSRVELLDETLDYASFTLTNESSIDTKKMKDVVTITVNDNSEIRSYYFLIDSDVATPIDKDDLTKSRHEISCIELTSRLSDYTVGYRQFTNESDDLFTILTDLTQTVFLNNANIDDFSRKIDIDLTHSSLQRLVNVQGRDFQFDNHTYFEAVIAIMNEVGGFPRVIYEGGLYKLTLDLKNERKKLREIFASSENNYKEQHNINKYATVMESYSANQVFDKTLAGASIVEPSSNGFMPVVSESEPFDSDSSFIRTRFNIRQITKVEVDLIYLIDGTTTQATKTVDITKRVVAEDVYKGLPVGDTKNVQVPSLSTTVTIGEEIDVEPTQRIGTLYFKDNQITNFFTFFGSTVWTEENWVYIVDACTAFEEIAFLVDNYDFKNIRMRVTYVPIFDGLLHTERYNTDDIEKFTMIQSSQSASTVSTETALKTLGAEINALGNKEIMTTSRGNLLSQEFDVGDYTESGYILTKKEIIYSQDEMIRRYEWDKDYQKRNEDISVKSEIRFNTIPSGGVSERVLYYKEYVYVGFDYLTSETTLLTTRGKEILTNIFGKESQYDTSIQNALVGSAEVRSITTPFILPVISVGGRNALNFNFGFQSPLVGGDRLDLTSQSIPLIEPINYADDNGELNKINFELLDTATTDAETLPLIDVTDKGNVLVSSIFNEYLVKKDSAETLSFAYQLHMIPNTNIVLGDYLIARNNLIETKGTFEQLQVWSSDEYYTQQETAKPKGTLTGVLVVKDSNENIRITDDVNNSAWAIATASGELVLAVNQFDSLQRDVPFNYFNSRFDINYEFIGENISAPPLAPTSLTVTTISAGVLELNWQDNATNETNFTIEISEDGTNFDFLDTVGVDITTYQADLLQASTQYWFRVAAYNQGGQSAYSNIANGITSPEPQPPQTPSNYIVVAQDDDKLNASWSASSGATHYELGIKRNDQQTYSEVTIDSSNLTYQWTGLNASTIYDTRIRAKNDDGFSGYATYIAITGSGTVETATPTINITNIQTNQVSFTVTNNDDDTATILADYRLGTSGDLTPDRTTRTGIASGSSTLITYDGLQQDTIYTLTANAQASGEEVSTIDSATFRTSEVLLPPDAPSFLLASSSSGGISLNWNNVENESGYTIELHYNSSFTNLAVSINKAADITSHLETPLLLGSYWCRIRAYNGNGESSWTTSNNNPVVL